jgi:multidrug efflux pump subunit AcrB
MDFNDNQKKDTQEGIADRKEFKLSSFSVDNNISVMVLVFLITIIGIQSYLAIPKEAQPDITIPNVLVITLYPGVAPEDMESLVTQKIEDKLSEIGDIKQLSSTTTEGYSSINAEFESDVDIDEAIQKVREKVDLAKPELPDAAEEPMIQEINLSQFPIMQVNISGDYSLVRLKRLAEDLQDDFENIPAVLEARLAGGLEREVKIDVDLPRLKYYGLSFTDIVTAIQTENVTVPGGNIEVGQKKFLVRVPGEYSDPELMRDIVVKANDDNPIYLRDVAEVDFGFKDRETYARLDGSPVITLSIVKRTGRNIIETAQAIKDIVEERRPGFPPTTEVSITGDMSVDISAMVSNLENNIISGLILVIGVLLFFLGVRNASFVGISIPLSMFMAFIILQALGFTMNMIVLFSLILALGMLVDNAIVVVENIYRYLEEGYSNFEAAKKGTGEVAMPIITGTLTTLAAFFPMVFWPGIVGEFMSFLPKTLIITLFSSLFIGLVINPVLCALFMKVDTENKRPAITKRGKIVIASIGSLLVIALIIMSPVTWGMVIVIGAILFVVNKFIFFPIARWWQKKGLGRILEYYKSSLIFALKNRVLTIVLSVGILVISFILFGIFNHGVEFFPEDIPPKQVYVQVEAPVGTDVEFNDEIIRQMESKVKGIPMYKDVESVVATSGQKISSGMGGGGTSGHLGTVSVNFKDYQEREYDVFNILEHMRENFGENVVGASIVVEKPQEGPPTGKPVNLEVTGKDLDELERISEEIIRILENNTVYSKLEGLDSNLPDSRPELRVQVDRAKAAKYGLSTQAVGQTIRQAINGVEASKFRDGKEEYDVTVRLAKNYRDDLNTLGDLNVMADKGRQIPLSEIASWSLDESFGGVKRLDQRRVVTVSADVRSDYQANEVLAEVQEVLNSYEANQLPAAYSMEWTGQQEEQQKAQEFLTNAFLIALFLIAFILISQFNSLIKPFIVISSVIMSIAGVLYGLLLFEMPFVIIMTGIGIVSLAGVVVNNAIVMIDYIDILRERDKMNMYDALVQGGLTRFRPVILTAITTVLGLVPLALGANFDFIVFFSDPIEFFTNTALYVYSGGEQAAWWAPMAIAVICGLTFATFLTLIVVPVLYSSFDSLSRAFARFFKGIEPEDPAADVPATYENSEISATSHRKIPR